MDSMSHDDRIAAIEAANRQLRQALEAAVVQNALQQHVHELEARLATDSHDSDKPPPSNGLARKTPSLRKSVIDASGKGGVVNEWIEAEERFSVDGLVYSSVLKPTIIQAGKIAVERGYVRFPFMKRMADQLATYVQAGKDLAQDLTRCFIQAMYKAREITGVAGARSVLSHAQLYQRGPLTAISLTRYNSGAKPPGRSLPSVSRKSLVELMWKEIASEVADEYAE
jgi:hypothetical protein